MTTKRKLVKELPGQKPNRSKEGTRPTLNHVPVLSVDMVPLMPTSSVKARKLLTKSKAIAIWINGLFAIRLTNQTTSNVQQITVGLDPGTKRDGLTIKSAQKTYLNLQINTETPLQKRLLHRKEARRRRRSRKTPYRKARTNRGRRVGSLAPSIKYRWDLKLRIISWFGKMYPISHFVVENVKAISKPSQRKWNVNFSYIQSGKKYFYRKIRALGPLCLVEGYTTHLMRNKLGLQKTHNKKQVVFSAHCVDSWVLANSSTNIQLTPDYTSVLPITPIHRTRRQLHKMQFARGHLRVREGGTKTLGFKRGSLVSHFRWGMALIGGHSSGLITLCSRKSNTRIARAVKPQDIRFIAYTNDLLGTL